MVLGSGATNGTTNGSAMPPAVESFPATVHAIVADLVDLDIERVPDGLAGVLGRLGSGLGVQSCRIVESVEGRPATTHGWWAPESPRAECATVHGGRSVADEATTRCCELQCHELQCHELALESQGELVGTLVITPAPRWGPRGPAWESQLGLLGPVLAAAVLRWRRDEARRQAERRLRAITMLATDHVMVLDDAGMVTYASPSFLALGVSPESLLGDGWFRWVPDWHRPTVREVLARMVAAPVGTVSTTVDFAANAGAHVPDEQRRWLEVQIHDLRNHADVGGFVLRVRDVTDRRQAQQARAQAERRDHITGLANRDGIEFRLERSVARAAAAGTRVGVLFLGIDRFKLINDSHGHATGDRLLAVVARRLAAVLRPTDHIGRFGGDEFVVLVENVADVGELEALAERLRRELRRSLDLGVVTVQLSASIGLALSGPGVVVPGDLLRDADTAMNRAKEQGRDRVATFDDRAHREVVRRNAIVQRLPLALAAGIIVPHFQPIVEIARGTIIGAEALARWDDPVIGRVNPDEFVPVAEELGLVSSLGLQILAQSLTAANRWPARYSISVNLSPAQLSDTSLPEKVAAVVHGHRFDPQRLCLEVTESSVMSHPDQGIDLLHRLRAMGVTLAMDDFGTGYSSLSMLRRIPVDVLKIDRSFVSGSDNGDADPRLVRAVIGLAEEFGMVTLAEGIETEEQRAILVDDGCRRGQGWLFSPPVTLAGFESAITVGSPRPGAP